MPDPLLIKLKISNDEHNHYFNKIDWSEKETGSTFFFWEQKKRKVFFILFFYSTRGQNLFLQCFVLCTYLVFSYNYVLLIKRNVRLMMMSQSLINIMSSFEITSVDLVVVFNVPNYHDCCEQTHHSLPTKTKVKYCLMSIARLIKV